MSVFHLANRLAKTQLEVYVGDRKLNHEQNPVYLGVKLDQQLTYRPHLTSLSQKIASRNALVRKLAGTSWGADAKTLRTASLGLVYSTAEYCAAVWGRSKHVTMVDTQINTTLRTITGCIKSTPTTCLPALANIPPSHLRRDAITLNISLRALSEKTYLLYPYLMDPIPPARLKSRRPFHRAAQEMVMTTDTTAVTAAQRKRNADLYVRKKWQDLWSETEGTLHKYIETPGESAPPGFDLPRTDWVRLNRLRTGHGRFRSNMYTAGYINNPACDCGAPKQTSKHIIEECPKHSAPPGHVDLLALDADTIDWIHNLAVTI